MVIQARQSTKTHICTMVLTVGEYTCRCNGVNVCILVH